ncbi:MAG: biopolymer transporter ExbD [Planctomycetes bacterium]|nr:biopolymer transporter ExbD [Planctomycetota bacterium]MBU4398135.1 biopolymer transporter ExbD [Planctomycetota bacterium]MCG2682499.1 biopolymer transporter ExbD [Planctomycetales bacterium]
MSDSQHPIDEEQAVLSFEHKDDSDKEVDMTPMIDCVFLLLIFFVVTASFQLQKALEIPPPEQKSPNTAEIKPDPEDDIITVRIDGDNTIWVNDSEAPSEQDLLLKLREARENTTASDGRPASILLVLADGEARHDVVVLVLDAGNSVGMEHIRLASADDIEM